MSEPIFSRASWATYAKLITVTEAEEGGFKVVVSCQEENIYSNTYEVSGVADITSRVTHHGNRRLTMKGGGTMPVITQAAFDQLVEALS